MTTSTAAPRPGRARVWRRALVMALLCGALVALIASDAVHGLLTEMLAAGEQVMRRHAVLGAAVFVGLAAASAVLAFFSSAVFVPMAVVTWGEPVGLLLLWLGWTLGGLCTYVIGRLPGRAMVNWLTADGALGRLEGRLRPDTPVGVVLLVQLALPSEIPGYVLGLVRYPLRRYLLALMLAELPYAVATIYISAGLVERRGVLIVIPGLAVAALGVVAYYAVRRRLLAAGAGEDNGAG